MNWSKNDLAAQEQHSLGWSSAHCALGCSLQHFPLAELVMGNRHTLGHASHATLAPFGLDGRVGSTSNCCAQNPSQDILSSRICLLAVHTCAWPWLKGGACCTKCFLGTGQAGAACFIAGLSSWFF